jgi:hypothetical protein
MQVDEMQRFGGERPLADSWDCLNKISVDNITTQDPQLIEHATS